MAGAQIDKESWARIKGRLGNIIIPEDKDFLTEPPEEEKIYPIRRAPVWGETFWALHLINSSDGPSNYSNELFMESPSSLTSLCLSHIEPVTRCERKYGVSFYEGKIWKSLMVGLLSKEFSEWTHGNPLHWFEVDDMFHAFWKASWANLHYFMVGSEYDKHWLICQQLPQRKTPNVLILASSIIREDHATFIAGNRPLTKDEWDWLQDKPWNTEY